MNYESENQQNAFENPQPASQTTPSGWDPAQHSQNPVPTAVKKGWSAGKVIALALVCAILGGICGAGGVVLSRQFLHSPETVRPEQSSTILQGHRENTIIQITQIDTSKQMTAAQVYALNVQSTVGITTSISTNYWGYQTTSAASGSGFILTSDGYILTNYHVIEGSDAITVSLYDDTSYKAALIGYDSSNDIAILKIDAADLTPVILGDSENMNVGDSVVAIGNPLGELTFSLTAGAVSALEREVTMSTGVTMTLIQTDCAINSGNSGGALFNLYGEVIGITNAKYSSSSSSEASIDNIGFAIPINDVQSIITNIIEKGYISKPHVGISVVNVSEELHSYGLPQGAAVKAVTEGSPAQTAGLQINDIITHVNDVPINGSSDLVAFVKDSQIGDQLLFTIYRQGETKTILVTVGEQIQSAQPEQTPQPQTQQQQSSPFPFPFPWGS